MAKSETQKIKPFEFEDITDSLTDRQKLFCMYYVGECKFNGTKAAEMAGYEPTNARSYASRLLEEANICKHIDLLKKDLGLRIGITAEMIAAELAAVGFQNIKDYVTDGNEITDISQLSDEKTKAVSSIKKTVITSDSGNRCTTEIKTHDKLNALLGLSKMIGADGVTKVANTDTEGNDKEATFIINHIDSPIQISEEETE